MPQCKVYGCAVGRPSYKGPHYVQHRFPDDEFMKRQWCSAINQDVATIKDHDKICSKHFEEDDLERKPDSQGRIPKIPRPKSTAVPSLFLDLVSSKILQVSNFRSKKNIITDTHPFAVHRQSCLTHEIGPQLDLLAKHCRSLYMTCFD